MKIRQYIIIFVLIVFTVSCSLNPADEKSEPILVEFPDPNFETLIRETLDKSDGEITNWDMWEITRLSGVERNITNISGIEHCSGLQRLTLRSNQIVDLTPLSELVLLNYIDVQKNLIEDIEPLFDNNGIGIGDDIIYLYDNPLNDKSILEFKPEIQSRGVKFYSNAQLSSPGKVHFVDENFENIIRQKLDIYDADLFSSDLDTITLLNGIGQNISNIYGIEFCSNLESLSLNNNNISDLIPIFYLREINQLSLNDNQISDISSIRSHYKLEGLSLENNDIGNIDYLNNLSKIEYLNLSGNPINEFESIKVLDSLKFIELRNLNDFDISILGNLVNLYSLDLSNTPTNNFEEISKIKQLQNLFMSNCNLVNIDSLANLTELKRLKINNNSISELTSLSALYNINEIDLGNNLITDILPLLNNWGLSGGDYLLLQNNPLNEISISTYIPILESRGVIVIY